MLRPDTFALTLLLSLLTALGPLSMDMYLPSLPAIALALHAPIAQVQLTISSYLFGFAVGQIVYGPISDRFGRKPVMLAALVLYGVATVLCATTQSIETLTAVRFVQALGGAGSIVLARAVVRDLYSGVRAGRELSLMGSITAFAPILAPAIGGILQTAFGWRASFILLVIFAAVSGSVATRLLPETLRQRAPGPFSLRSMAVLYRSVLVHRGFLANLGILTTTFVGLMAWVSAASVVMQGVYGLSPLVFGATYAVGAAGYMLGTSIAARIVMRLGLDRTIGIGTVALAAGGLAMVAVVALGLTNAVWLVAAMTIYLAGLGLAMPQTMAGALTPFPDRAGTASSLMGFTQQSCAAIAAAAIGNYLGQSAWPVASVVATMGCLAFVIWVLTRGVRTAEQ
ncbi:MAG TPA: multidrug effflux MFS transporter [Xanthobacteraceae bacterium]|nr:multidrug effflux MFS transporter [Xanthobacteraceae bacterium]